METIHDDLPHPVPPSAYLRYKENWFFIFLDVDQDVFGQAHFSYEPGNWRGRFSCNVLVRGELHQYHNEIPFPADFAYSKRIGDDALKIHFIEPHALIEAELNSDAIEMRLQFAAHSPMFDWGDYEDANPDRVSFRELANAVTNQRFSHQTQAMLVDGVVRMKQGKLAGQTLELKGKGYRDHSRGLRCDNLNQRHVWSFLYFPDRIFGAMSISSLVRPAAPAGAGYVYDDKIGLRSLRDVDISIEATESDPAPKAVVFELSDVMGSRYTVRAQTGSAFGVVPLSVESAQAGIPVYDISEIFCPIELVETGERGFALVEVGASNASGK